MLVSLSNGAYVKHSPRTLLPIMREEDVTRSSSKVMREISSSCTLVILHDHTDSNGDVDVFPGS